MTMTTTQMDMFHLPGKSEGDRVTPRKAVDKLPGRDDTPCGAHDRLRGPSGNKGQGHVGAAAAVHDPRPGRGTRERDAGAHGSQGRAPQTADRSQHRAQAPPGGAAAHRFVARSPNPMQNGARRPTGVWLRLLSRTPIFFWH